MCGPLGSFHQELNYVGDARVLFDYFFPGVLTSAGGSAVNIPINLIANWTTVYEPAVRKAVNSNLLATLQYLSAANISVGLSLSNAADAITEVLSYNVIATDDAHITLGGNPYDNIGRVYHGSFNDARLNAMVARLRGGPGRSRQSSELRDLRSVARSAGDAAHSPIRWFRIRRKYSMPRKCTPSIAQRNSRKFQW